MNVSGEQLRQQLLLGRGRSRLVKAEQTNLLREGGRTKLAGQEGRRASVLRGKMEVREEGKS